MNANRIKKLVRKSRAPALLEGDDLAADILQTKPKRGPALNVFRQYSAINEFNEEGITMFCIGLGLNTTVYAQRARLLRGASADCVDLKSAPYQCPLIASRMNSEPAAAHLIQRGDDQRARFIRETPLALVMSIEHQDAFARWAYAQSHGTSIEARRQAATFLHLAAGRRPGRIKKHSTDPASLAQAFFDLVNYLLGLRKCADKVNTVQDLMSNFPDCRPVLKTIGSSPEIQVTHDCKRIAPPTAAITILIQIVGLKRSQIQKLLKPYRH